MLLRPSIRPLARIAVAHRQRLRAFAASIGFTIDRHCSRGASSVSAAQPRSRPSPLVAPAPGTDASGVASEVAQLLELAVGWRKIVRAEREYAKSLAIPQPNFQKLGRVLTQLELALPRISAVLGESPTPHSTALAKELSMLCSALAKESLSFPHVAALPVHTLLSILVALLQIPPEHRRLRNLELESLWSACLFSLCHHQCDLKKVELVWHRYQLVEDTIDSPVDANGALSALVESVASAKVATTAAATSQPEAFVSLELELDRLSGGCRNLTGAQLLRCLRIMQTLLAASSPASPHGDRMISSMALALGQSHFLPEAIDWLQSLDAAAANAVQGSAVESCGVTLPPSKSATLDAWKSVLQSLMDGERGGGLPAIEALRLVASRARIAPASPALTDLCVVALNRAPSVGEACAVLQAMRATGASSLAVAPSDLTARFLNRLVSLLLAGGKASDERLALEILQRCEMMGNAAFDSALESVASVHGASAPRLMHGSAPAAASSDILSAAFGVGTRSAKPSSRAPLLMYDAVLRHFVKCARLRRAGITANASSGAQSQAEAAQTTAIARVSSVWRRMLHRNVKPLPETASVFLSALVEELDFSLYEIRRLAASAGEGKDAAANRKAHRDVPLKVELSPPVLSSSNSTVREQQAARIAAFLQMRTALVEALRDVQRLQIDKIPLKVLADVRASLRRVAAIDVDALFSAPAAVVAPAAAVSSARASVGAIGASPPAVRPEARAAAPQQPTVKPSPASGAFSFFDFASENTVPLHSGLRARSAAGASAATAAAATAVSAAPRKPSTKRAAAAASLSSPAIAAAPLNPTSAAQMFREAARQRAASRGVRLAPATAATVSTVSTASTAPASLSSPTEVPRPRAPALSVPTVSVDDAEFWTKVFANEGGAATNGKAAVDASVASAPASAPAKASLVL